MILLEWTLSPSRDIPTRKATDEILNKASVQVTVAMEFDNVETVKRAIEINAGIAILPASTVITESERKQLVTYKLEGGMHNRPLAVIHKKPNANACTTVFC